MRSRTMPPAHGLTSGRYEDRRKGLRDEGVADEKFAHAVLSETPTSWRLEIEPVAIRGIAWRCAARRSATPMTPTGRSQSN
jgi:hypothetical protein